MPEQKRPRVESYSIENPIPTRRKQIGVWLVQGNTSFPFAYFQRPKGIKNVKAWEAIMKKLRFENLTLAEIEAATK